MIYLSSVVKSTQESDFYLRKNKDIMLECYSGKKKGCTEIVSLKVSDIKCTQVFKTFSCANKCI